MQLALLITAALAAVATKEEAPVAEMRTAFGDLIGPLTSCGGSSDSFTLGEVVLTPYPVQIGQPLVVSATGTLSKAVTQGATLQAVAKFGFIKVLDETFDLCAEAAKSGKPCPLTEGPSSFQVIQNIPGSAPEVSVNLEITGKNADGSPLTCLRGRIQLRRRQ
jgi:hypothetical protein